MASIPATYKFLNTFPDSSNSGGSTTNNLLPEKGVALTDVLLTSQTNAVGSGLVYCLCTRMFTSWSDRVAASNKLSPCINNASSGQKQCSAQ